MNTRAGGLVTGIALTIPQPSAIARLVPHGLTCGLSRSYAERAAGSLGISPNLGGRFGIVRGVLWAADLALLIGVAVLTAYAMEAGWSRRRAPAAPAGRADERQPVGARTTVLAVSELALDQDR